MADVTSPDPDQIAGRNMAGLIACLSEAKFDPQKYTANNAPLQKMSFTETEALQHYLTSGYQNGLRVPADALAAALPKLLSIDIADHNHIDGRAAEPILLELAKSCFA